MIWIDILILFFTLLWIGEFLRFKSRKSTDQDENRSFPVILFSVILVIATGVLTRELGLWTVTSLPLSAAGAFLFGGGILLRYWGIVHLGKQFTRDVQVREGDTLVGTGPYRLLRHPLYTGLFAAAAGFSLYTGSIAAFLLAFITLLPALIRRMQSEEQTLIGAFGKTYQEWMKTRYRFIPFLY
ncbi:methyltransferase family protein [Salisediminibacterium selenitireducens]|uniref:Isoprenylcysteine carboxyl methyltransferase n=1 Tax=Bacillus selenitireducens (strain ATCC 700615 / DSM 15326 / MLS10) TaxID=439292 RepID=D6Y118_BACIE|nr:isoprenylcysteine carboxylmethyltransferase family protein [Salisediminibacterium selenitireducens]ADH98622.1 Isoprenylcysteine carboxyl methyltransferase [[Bacillus] selenitireducens MLS10]